MCTQITKRFVLIFGNKVCVTNTNKLENWSEIHANQLMVGSRLKFENQSSRLGRKRANMRAEERERERERKRERPFLVRCLEHFIAIYLLLRL